MANENRRDYWEQFYSSHAVSAPTSPSQFAAFVLNELPQVQSIVELGCGNGRDADFFASCGIGIFALDASAEAIKFCEGRRRYRNLVFGNYLLSDSLTPIKSYIAGSRGFMALYARFFLHAITEEDEKSFFKLAKDAVPTGSFVALEYRVLEDAQGEKAFGSHYRRYVNHSHICRALTENGFEVLYEIQGIGLAKYKNEDAKVGRCIARRIK